MSAADRYARQVRLSEVGAGGQGRLAQAAVVVAGCGALGAMIATVLARSGVGRLTLVDRDVVDLSNLHRQVLFEEQDVSEGLPKAEAAARRLRRVNSEIEVHAVVADITPANIEALVDGADLIMDGTDNFEARYLINDVCVQDGIPWVYGGVIGTSGMTLAITPGQGPCLRCLFSHPPAPGSVPTCESRGVLGSLPMAVGAIQATAALALLVGQRPPTELISLDPWRGSYQTLAVRADEACPCCARRRFDFLRARRTAWVTSLCGRDAVQITPGVETRLDLEQLSRRLAAVGHVSSNGLLLTLAVEGRELLIFPDGRVIVRGTTDEIAARDLHARYLGV